MQYGALLLVDPEEETYAEEVSKLAADVAVKGLGLIVIGEWYNVGHHGQDAVLRRQHALLVDACHRYPGPHTLNPEPAFWPCVPPAFCFHLLLTPRSAHVRVE